MIRTPYGASRSVHVSLALFVLCATLGACVATEPEAPVRWLTPPRIDPVRVRFETEIFELPLGLAEAQYRAADPRSSTIGVAVDETEIWEALSALRERSADVVHAVRAPIEVVPDASAPIPPRASSAQGSAKPLASDSLHLTVSPRLSYAFAPFELELSFQWLDELGGRLAQFHGKTAAPADRWLRIVCIPSKERGAPDAALPVRAVFAFVRLMPVHEGVEVGRLDAHEGLATDHGSLENIGDQSIEYSIRGDLVFEAIDLGVAGRARWRADHSTIAIRGGNASTLICIGDANRLRVLAGAKIDVRSIELEGRDNRCEDERGR